MTCGWASCCARSGRPRRTPSEGRRRDGARDRRPERDRFWPVSPARKGEEERTW